MTAASQGQRIAAIILCGGRSTRMGGGDKCLERLGNSTPLARLVERLRPQAAALAINANGDLSRFSQFDLPVIADPMPGHRGPLAGLLAGLLWAGELNESDALLTVAGDTPFIPADLAARLQAARAGDPTRIAVAASDDRRHPVVALWPLLLRRDLESFLADAGTGRVTAFQDRHPTVEVDFPFQAVGAMRVDPFFNINTRDDLAAAERLVAGAAP